MQKSTKPAQNNASYLLKLCDDVSLKHLEQFYVYNKVKDELYEIDETTCNFLKSCNGHERIGFADSDSEFIDYCISENILAELKEPRKKRDITISSSDAAPSLRYLELLITDRCNLTCRHCYLKRAGKSDMPIESIEKIFSEFGRLGGLRMIVSGGEPLLHKDFNRLNELIPAYDFRSILLTNGTLLNKHMIDNLNFNEVQISVDGLKKSHDHIRGAGNFEKSITAIKLLNERGIDVSVATMALKNNIDELEEFSILIDELGIKKWEVDVPCAMSDDDIFLDYENAGTSFKYGFSSGLYNSADGYACGAHLMTVMNDGMVSKCSFFSDRSVGSIADGLIANFMKIDKIRLEELECDCEFLDECRGGCRYRAYLGGGINQKDKAKCSYFLNELN